MEKTILITGINGFLGSNLAKKLKSNFKVIGLEYSINDLFRISEENFKVYASGNNLKDIFEENEIYGVIHAATLYNRVDTPIEDVINTNVLLPIKLYELALIHKVKLFINTDSFFNNPKYNYSFLPDYTLSKKHSIEWLKLRQDSNCKLVNMKIFHMYGPSDAPNKFVPYIIQSLKDNIPFIDTTQGEQTRDFVFIEDVVDAYNTVLSSFDKLPNKFTEYEVGTGKETTVKEFILKIKSLANSETEIRFGAMPYRENEIMNSKSNNKELINLGWNSCFPIDEGIKQILKE